MDIVTNINSFGIMLKEELKNRGLSQKDYAETLGIRPSHLSEMLKGKRPIPNAILPSIAMFVGISVNQLMVMSNNASSKKSAKSPSPEEQAAQSTLLEYDKVVSIKSLLKGLSAAKDSFVNKVNFIQSYYGLISPASVESVNSSLSGSCFRRSFATGLDMRMISTWVVKARKIALQNIPIVTYNSSNNNLLEKELCSIFHNNIDVKAATKRTLERYGIGFSIVPKESNASIDGYSFFENEHPYIVVSCRYDRIDNFAFTVLHELGHIVLGHTNKETQMLNIEFSPNEFDGGTDKENAADEFATNCLIPQKLWMCTPKVPMNPFTIQKIFTQWANQHNLNKWIVLGRVSHETGMYRFKSDDSRKIN